MLWISREGKEGGEERITGTEKHTLDLELSPPVFPGRVPTQTGAIALCTTYKVRWKAAKEVTKCPLQKPVSSVFIVKQH